MAEITKELGRIPVSRGNYQATAEYYKDNIVQYKRGSYQVVSESPIIGIPPTNDKNIVNPGWTLFAGTLDAQDVVNQIKEQEAKSIQAVADREAEILAKSDAAKVSFDNTGTSLSGTNVQDALEEIDDKVIELEKKEGIINTVKYSDTSRFESLAEALAAIPASDRVGHAMIYYLDNSFNYHIYLYVSAIIEDENWNNLSYWIEVPIVGNIDEINNAIAELPTIKNNINGTNSKLQQLDDDTKDVRTAFKNLKSKKAIFNGTTSVAKWDIIALQEEGDYIEITFSGLEDLGDGIYSATQGVSQGNMAISISSNQFALRTFKDNADYWIIALRQIEDSDTKKVRIEYKNGNIISYVNGALINTYSGQDIQIYLSGAGKNALWPYWKGEIGLVKIHTASLDFNGYIDNLPGYTSTDVVIESSINDGFLNTEQSNTLAKVPTLENNISSINTEISKIQEVLNGLHVLPNCVVSTISDNRVNVYFKISQNTYGMLTIWHMVTDEEGQYKWRNLWGIYSDGGLYSYDNDTFTYLNKKLLIGAENEFAIQFQGMGDFTGGYHGYERIDKDSSCYNVFLVNGQEQTFEQLAAKGTFACDEFGYRQRSQMFTGFAHPTPKIHFADHVKTTTFKDGGFTSRNYIDFDLSILDLENLFAGVIFTGLVCVHKDCASKVVGDDGRIYNAVHPESITTLVESINKASLRVITRKDNFSCEVNSKVVGTNIEVFKDAQPNVKIMDRADDCKYYSYLPATNVKTGDCFETEVTVKWKYNSTVIE